MDQQAIEALATELVDMLPDAVLQDLRSEDPSVAVEVHFHPIECVDLPPAIFMSSECSVDGYYESTLDPDLPRILADRSVAIERYRFTVLHELGHHLVETDACFMLDRLDEIGGSPSGAQRAEEQLCHQFAAKVLIPDQVLTDSIQGRKLRPADVIAVHDRTNASWEAVAIRAARFDGQAVVVLVRQDGLIAFSTTRDGRWWPRQSQTQPGGPLHRALHVNSGVRQDVFRHGLGYSAAMFCETRKVHDDLAVGVMRPRRADSQFDVLSQPEPLWKEREEWCFWCDEERDEGWCETCRSRRCHDCNRCGCSQPLQR